MREAPKVAPTRRGARRRPKLAEVVDMAEWKAKRGRD
jgi:hypothetical protein